MGNEQEVTIQGDSVIEKQIVSTTYDKTEYLAQKMQELSDHKAGVIAYNEAADAKRDELEDLINSLQE